MTGDRKMKKRFLGKKGTAIVAIAVEMVLLVSGAVFCAKLHNRPYVISSNDKAICYVENKKAATASITQAVQDLSDKDSEVRLFSTDSGLKVAPAGIGENHEKDIVSVKDASELIVSEAKNEASNLVLDVVSVRSEMETFKLDPLYKEDGTKLAGYTNVEEKGEDGKAEVTYVCRTVDGKQSEKNEIERTVVKEGKQAVITKGTLGVPEGEAWETYTGSPVLNDGNDIIVSAKQYVGKLKYVKGGTSLTNGVDCVGFVQQIYKLYGVKLTGLKGAGRKVSYSEAQPGDIICYEGHYGLYMGNGKMVHAANAVDDVCIGKVSKSRIVTIRRILN